MKTKKILLLGIVFLSIFVLSCDKIKEKQEAKKIKQRELEYQETVIKEIESNKRFDEIFMNFRLGDSKQQVTNKFGDLINQKKLYLDENNNYTYDVILNENVKTTAHFSTEYHNDKLYKFILMVEPLKSNLSTSLNLFTIMVYLPDIYKEKYGFFDHFEEVILGNGFNCYWINGNREISIIQRINDIHIIYLDKKVGLEIEKKEKQEIEIQKKEISSDI